MRTGKAHRSTSLEYWDSSALTRSGLFLAGTVRNEYNGAGQQTNSTFFVLEALATRAECAALLSAARDAASTFKIADADSIDGKPTFERYLVEHGEIVHTGLHDAFVRDALRDRLVEHVRKALGCASCELCDVLVRRYLPNERRVVPPHSDVNAFATAILTLNAEDFVGGYYMLSHDRASPYDASDDHGDDAAESGDDAHRLGRSGAMPRFLPLDSGSLLVHDHRVHHGVNVTRGERYALIGWFKDRPGLCASDDNPWISENAAAGDGEAMELLAKHAEQLGDAARALEWSHKAAAAGHAGAMIRLAMHLFRSREPVERAEATRLTAEASRLGRRDAMAVYAWALDKGVGLSQADPVEALRWRRKAAALGHVGAMRELELVHAGRR